MKNNILDNITLNNLETENDKLSVTKDYWMGKLSGELNKGIFPYDLANSAEGGTKYKAVEFVMPENLYNSLTLLSNKSDFNIYIILVAALTAVINRYTGNNDIILGAPILKQEIEGEYLNTILPLRNKISYGMTFRDLLLQVRQTVLEANENMNYPVDRLIKHLEIDSGTKKFPLFEIVILLQNLHDKKYIEHTKPNILFSFTRTETGMEGLLEYNSELYIEATVNGIINNLINLLTDAVKNNTAEISKLNMLSGEEKKRLLIDFNSTGEAYEKHISVAEMFERQVKLTADNTAIVFEHKRLTYGELNGQANRLANHLTKIHGIGKGDMVGLFVSPSESMIIAIMAILKIGAAYIPFDKTMPLLRLKNIIDGIGLKYVLSDSGESFEAENFIDINKLMENSEEEPDEFKSDSAGNCAAYVIFTSGTTGLPKGVVVENSNLLNYVSWFTKAANITEKDKTVLLSSIAYDLGYTVLFSSLLNGCELHIVSKDIYTNSMSFLKYIHDNEISYLKMTPSLFGTVVNSDDFNPSYMSNGLRLIVLGGERIKLSDIEKINSCCPYIQFMNHYGPTECTIGSVAGVINPGKFLSPGGETIIGKPIQNTWIYIVDAELNLLPAGIPGEICIAGDGVARGYLNNEELNRQKFVYNPFSENENTVLYRTGDLGRFLQDGSIAFLGRNDQQVKVRGYRIETGEIENSLLKHKYMKEAVVIPHKDEQENTFLCSYFVAVQELTVQEIRNHLCSYLPEYMIPLYFIKLDEIPLTQNGKIDLRKLPKPDFKKAGESGGKPKNETEEKLIEIWQSVLGIENMGTEDNFFNMGGDSIKVIRLVSRINKELAVHIEMNDIYIYQTVSGLAAYIDEWGQHETGDKIQRGREILDKFKSDILGDKEQASNLPDNYEDFYPLSPIQEGMLFYSLVNSEKPIYHNRAIFLTKFNNFDFGIFCRAIKLLTERHPMLRTAFNIKQFSRPIQIVYKTVEPHITICDISQLSKDRQEESISQYLKEDMENRFGFENEILWRIRLFKLNESDYCIIKTHHHSITDGWSSASLSTEIINTYNGLLRGEISRLEPLKSTFKDYVALNLARGISEETQRFWKTLLKDYSRNKLLFNPTGKKINNLNTSKIVVKDFGHDLLKKLEYQARKHGVTIKDICAAAYVCMISGITNERDIVTGIVTHDRPAFEDGDRIQGCFLNTVPMRIKLESGALDKKTVLEKVRDYLNEVKKHELFLGDIVKITATGNTKENPIFDALFNFINFHVFSDMEGNVVSRLGDDLHFEPGSENMTNTLFDLEVNKTLNDFIVHIKYSPDYFEHKNIQSALDMYARILDSYGDDISGVLTVRHIISGEERIKTLYEFNDSFMKYPMNKTIHRLFEEQAERTPNNTALVFDRRHVTYKELNEKANKLARLLIDRGVKPGDLVGVIVQRGFELITSLLAVLKSGCAYVPIDPDYPAARQEYIASNSGLSALLADDSCSVNSVNTIRIDSLEMEKFDGSNTEVAVDSDKLAYVIYTSGSTGQPKGVMIEHHSAVNLITWVNSEFNINGNDSLLFITPVCFDLSVYDIFGILASGGRIVIAGKDQVQNPQELKRLLVEEKITFWDSVPSTMNYLVNVIEESDPGYRQQDLRLVFLSGDWIPVRLPEKIKKYFTASNIISLGGATEGTVWSIYHPITHVGEFQSSIPYGRPIGNNFFYILDENREIMPDGTAGELYIGGVGVAAGYINDEEKTKKSFVCNNFINPELKNKLKNIFTDHEAEFYIAKTQRMYKTGDLGRMQPDGNIEFLGRIDHQVKIRGFRVEPGEVESRILNNESVKEAVVVDRTDQTGNKYLCAYLVMDTDLTVADLRNYLAEVLPDYMIPSFFVKVDSIPLTSNGKVDRKSLPEPDGSIGTGTVFEAPANEIERTLEAIWKEILNIDSISVNDSFYEIGGNSLLIIQMHNKIEKYFKNLVKVTDLFVYSTIRELAGFILKQKESSGRIDIKYMTAREEYMADINSTGGSNVLNFSLNGDIYEKVKLKSQELDISLTDILLSLFVYTLTEIDPGDQVTVQKMVSEDDMVSQMSVDLSRIESFSELLRIISSYDAGAETVGYGLQELNRLNLSKERNKFVPFFCLKHRRSSRSNIAEVFNIIMEAEFDSMSINIMLEYDSKMFREEKMKEMLDIYIRLLQSFAGKTRSLG